MLIPKLALFWPAGYVSIAVVVLLVSPPSPTTAFVLDCLSYLLTLTAGCVETIYVSDVEKLRSEWLSRRTNNLIIHTDRPRSDLSALLSRVPVPTVFVAEDPVDCALFLHLRHKTGILSAVRQASSSYACLQELVRQSNQILRLNPRHSTPADWPDEITEFLGLSPQSGAAFAKTARPALRLSSGAAFDIPAKLRDVMETALAPYRNVCCLRAMSELPIVPALFMVTDPLGAAYNGQPLPLVGPARILLYGPYLHLPAGEWTLSVRFAVEENISGNHLRVEVVSGLDVVKECMEVLPEEGTYIYSTEFAITHPEEPLQIRLAISEGAIEGFFTLHGCHARACGDMGGGTAVGSIG